MKTLRKIIICLLVFVIAAAAPITAHAAIEAEAGKSVTVSFTLNKIFGVDGFFEFSNKSIFKSIKYSYSGRISGDISNDKVFLYGSNEVDVKITVTVTLNKNAKVGSSCDIKLNYETSDPYGRMSDWMTMTKTVKVKATPVVTEPPVTEPPETDPPETEPPETEPVIDYSELEKQIKIASGLNESDYTSESWARLAEALAKGIDLLQSKSQSEVDEGAEELARAIAALVRIDFSALRQAVKRAHDLDDKCAHGKLWFELFDLLTEADAILNGGTERDQARSDELAKKINGKIDEILEDYANHKTGETVEIIKEVTVQVPVEPTDPYCNIPRHKVWPVLFFIALGIILLLTALYLLFFVKRKKNQKDDTPIVDYDIADDDVTKEF